MNAKKLTALCMTGAITASVLSGCGINANQTVATMEGKTVTLGIVNFMARYQQAVSDDLYRAYFGDDVWEQDLYGNGSTMADTFKGDVVDSLHEMYTLQAHMGEYNVALSAEETAKIDETVVAFMNANSADTLKEMGATEELVKEYLTLSAIQQKMHDAIIVGADTNVSDEEANMRGYTYVQTGIVGYYGEDSNYAYYTEDEVAALEAEFNQMYDEIVDPSDLETVAESYGYSATAGSYGADDDSLDENVKAALDALSEGQLSSVITTDSALYIVRLDTETDADATEENRQRIIETRQETFYADTVSAWQENDGWKVKERVLQKISFKNGFTAPQEETETESVAPQEGTETESATQ